MLPPKEVLDATRRRVEERYPERERTKRLVKEGKPLEAEEKGRLALRTTRLLANPAVGEMLGARPGSESRARVETRLLERIIKGDNLLDAWFFEAGMLAARAVGRIHVRSADGDGFGTGSMVSPRLLLTNHHVLDGPETAAGSLVEFDYQTRSDGAPMRSHAFKLRPDLFFLTDGRPDGLDFTLVAVDETSTSEGAVPLSRFGHIPVTSAQGKIALGECVNIIQHPNGDPKKLAIQDNELVDRLELFLHYETDTMPGSSGALLFSNQWEVVGLHHSGLPETDGEGRILNLDGQPWQKSEGEERINWIANEGIRISEIVRFAEARLGDFDGDKRTLLDAFVAPSRSTTAGPVTAASRDGATETANAARAATEVEPSGERPPPPPENRTAIGAAGEPGGGLRLTVPLHIEVRLGEPTVAGAAYAPSVRAASSALPVSEGLKTPFIERPYGNRRGYRAGHLGIEVPLPHVTDEAIVSKMQDGSWEIPYEHFTVVLNRRRRMALFTASNLNGDPRLKKPEPGRDYSRKGLSGLSESDQERWVVDPRVPAEDQLPDGFYNRDRQAFDKGHIVRREEVCWGESYEQVRRANGDTFHATNLSPQVAGYNRSNLGEDNWGDLENEIADQLRRGPISLFAGPIFAENDRAFEGRDDVGRVEVRIPSRYWKVVVSVEGERLQAFGFLLRQDLQDVRFREFRPTDVWKRFLVPLEELQGSVRGFAFPQAVLDADQYAAVRGR